MRTSSLPHGSAPAPVPLPHFPDALHAVVWRNWELVEVARLAQVLRATPEQIVAVAESMGLPPAPPLSATPTPRRTTLTLIRRNWHLLPYEQLLDLLGWDAAQMAFTLREDDFLWEKLGSLKPACPPVHYAPPSPEAQQRAAALRRIVETEFGPALHHRGEPLFAFLQDLTTDDRRPTTDESETAPRTLPERGSASTPQHPNTPTPNIGLRFLYSYFAPYGDPLLEPECDPYPEGYLARLAALGVNGVWLQGVLHKLAPWRLAPELAEGYEQRLESLRQLVARARRQGIGVYLYVNEPRAMPPSFFERYPELRGVTEGEFAALCTSMPAVQEFLVESLAAVFAAVPDLAGVFTISMSENLTNCHSRGHGDDCPRCRERGAATVVAEVNRRIAEGVWRSRPDARVLVWDWGWRDDWAEEAIAALPDGVWLMSVSEWSLPIERGGVRSEVGEYSISSVGPGPRAAKHWAAARRRGLKTAAKVQINNTWELSAVPYIPVPALVAEHMRNVTQCEIDALMLGWTLGGYPSPNVEVAAEFYGSGGLHPLRGYPVGRSGVQGTEDASFVMRHSSGDQTDQTDGPDRTDGTDGTDDASRMTDELPPNARTPERLNAQTAALETVARRRFGEEAAPMVVRAWEQLSAAFREFPFHIHVGYFGPQQIGPANLLYREPTGYKATMLGFPYDDLDGWRAIYPPDVFQAQIDKLASAWRDGLATLQAARDAAPSPALEAELRVADAAYLHFQSVANQVAFVQSRQSDRARAEELLRAEIDLARRLFDLVNADSRIGFEASNQYFYTRLDLVEKVLNCYDLLDGGHG